MPSHLAAASARIGAAAQSVPTDPGATAWVLVATALVLLMTPGIAFYYGGMVRARNVLSLLMQSYTVIAVVALLWMIAGFSLVFGGRGGFVGDLGFAGLVGLDEPVPGFEGDRALRIPTVAFAAFQMVLAALVPAIITGATADRLRFGPFVGFSALWLLAVYVPVAHWVLSPLGWASSMGALDFAGGVPIHATAGAAALALVLVLGRRRGWPRSVARPHNAPLSLLWFGWFGANGGAALRADEVAATALLNTQLSASAALLAWVGVERLRFGRPTTLGAVSGAVAGLVAATPCAGYVAPPAAALVGLVAGAACAGAVSLKLWFRLDDAVDVVGVHLVGAAVGVLALGLFGSTEVNAAGRDGVFYGGGYDLLGAQAGMLTAVVVYAFASTFLVAGLLDRVVGLRVPARDERLGLDLALHGELAYDREDPDDRDHPDDRDQPDAPLPAQRPAPAAPPVPALAQAGGRPGSSPASEHRGPAIEAPQWPETQIVDTVAGPRESDV